MISIFEISKNSLFALWAPSTLLAQETSDYTSPSAGVSPVFMIIWLLVVVLMIAAMWKIFTKAGQPGWASLIPIYKHVHLVQDRRPTRLVGHFDAHPVRQFHHFDHSLR
jgi:hypothetical protein